MRFTCLFALLFLSGCASTHNPATASSSGPTLYLDCMKNVCAKSAGNLTGRGHLVVEKNPTDGFVRAVTLGNATVIPSQVYSYSSNSVNPYKVDNIVMDNHEIASCTTTFWSGAK
jgi:hypothetical protein